MSSYEDCVDKIINGILIVCFDAKHVPASLSGDIVLAKNIPQVVKASTRISVIRKSYFKFGSAFEMSHINCAQLRGAVA